MDAETEILVGLLAETDATWLPVRDWTGPAPKSVHAARAAFEALGVTWISQGRTVADRKEAERALRDLEAGGLVTVHKPRNRSLCAKLTDPAEWRARELAGLPDAESAWLSVRKLAAHSDRRPRTMDRLWVPETVLAGVDWGGPDRSMFSLAEMMILPALARGWVRSNSDCVGRVYYALTPLGWSMADAGYDPPPPPGVDFDPAARAAYHARLNRRLSLFTATDPPEGQELGGLPLPVSMQGVPAVPLGPDLPHPDADTDLEPVSDPTATE